MRERGLDRGGIGRLKDFDKNNQRLRSKVAGNLERLTLVG